MDELDALGALRRLVPRLFAIVVATAFLFLPQLSTALLMEIAQERAQRITALFSDALESTLDDSPHHQSGR